ncbi:hypothetical protein [Streptomyces sp. NPDC059063]|uniref:hypothetical protein n=1 Tax=Streptomyces sp. NPDC059063 TaxID=3346712 RepID=UPI00368B2BAB
MIGPAFVISVFAAIALFLSGKIYARGKALRVRGVRASVLCVNESRNGNGQVFLLARHVLDGGAELQLDVGPFRYPPARIGGTFDVVYDPNDPRTVETPEKVPDGRAALISIGVCALVLLLGLVLIALSV